jgi:curved DNA-binding protein
MPGPAITDSFVDYYEHLQVSSNADFETIEKVYRLLAKRYHPDTKPSGNAEKFRLLVDAYRVLSDPEKRAAYDARYDDGRASHWKKFVEVSPSNGVEADGKIQEGILLLLYSARRQDALNPGIGIFELQRLLACPENQIEFHVWYLREKGWIQRTENGTLAITATGVDTVTKSATRLKDLPLLPSGDSAISQNAPSRD